MSERHNFPIAALASGSGTTLNYLGHSIVANKLPLEIHLVIYDRPGAAVADVVDGLNETYGWDVKSTLIAREDYPKGPGAEKWHLTDGQSEAMALEFQKANIFVGLQLGLLSLTRGDLFDEYGYQTWHTKAKQCALLNTHPGFLWQTKGLYGKYVHQKVVADESDKSAQTLHAVAAEYDEGPEVAVNEVAVLPTYTWQDVEREVQAVEKMFIGPDVVKFAKARKAYLDG